MLAGQGYYRGSTVLVSGTAGTGKTSLAAHFADAACRRGERCLYFLFEESPQQMVRNMRSAGIDLQPWVDSRPAAVPRGPAVAVRAGDASGAQCTAPSSSFGPDVVVIDPMTNLLMVGTQTDVRAMLTRIIDFLKMRNVTALFTSLTPGGAEIDDDRDDDLVADGHVDPDHDRTGRAPPASLALRAEVTRHGAFRRDAASSGSPARASTSWRPRPPAGGGLT